MKRPQKSWFLACLYTTAIYCIFSQFFDREIDEHANASVLFDFSLWIALFQGLLFLSRSLVRSALIGTTILVIFTKAHSWKMGVFGAPIMPEDLLFPLQYMHQYTGISVALQGTVLLLLFLAGLYSAPFTEWIRRLSGVMLLVGICSAIVMLTAPKLPRFFFWQPGYNRKNAVNSGLALHTAVTYADRLHRIFFQQFSAEQIQNAEKILLANTAADLPLHTTPPPSLIVTVQLESYAIPENSLGTYGCTGPEIRDLFTNTGLTLGNLIVPTYAGGSSATEFEVLCGLPANMIEPRAGIEFGSFLKNNIPCLPKVAERSGNPSTAFFPFQVQYFNEIESYKRTGFTSIQRLDYSLVKDFDGMHPSDAAVYAWVLSELEHKSSSRYIHMQTAAGHYPFKKNPSRRPDVIFCKNTADQNLLNRMYYSTIELIHFAEDLRAITPNVLFIAYGDHKPMHTLPGEDISSPLKRFTTPLVTMNLPPTNTNLFAYELPYLIQSLMGFNADSLPRYNFSHEGYFLRPVNFNPDLALTRTGSFITCNSMKKKPFHVCEMLTKKSHALKIVVADALFGRTRQATISTGN